MSSDAQIICGDSAVELLKLEAGSVQLCVTSPPYDKLRTAYGCMFDFEVIAKELYRVLCDGGVVCWNVNDSVVDGSETLTSCKQKIFFVEQCGFRCHDTMIWKKVHVAAPNSRQYHQMFEYILVLSKGSPRVFNPIEDRPNKWAGKSPFGHNSKRQANGEMKKTAERGVCAPFGRRSNVWEGNSRAQEQPCRALPHPAMMAQWLARDLIRSWSNSGDTVLDPFGGSGTTGAAAIEWGRKAILIERELSYIPIISESISKVQPMQIT